MAELEADIKVRVSIETKLSLARIAAGRREGTNTSDIAREAIGEFLERVEQRRNADGLKSLVSEAEIAAERTRIIEQAAKKLAAKKKQAARRKRAA